VPIHTKASLPTRASRIYPCPPDRVCPSAAKPRHDSDGFDLPRWARSPPTGVVGSRDDADRVTGWLFWQRPCRWV